MLKLQLDPKHNESYPEICIDLLQVSRYFIFDQWFKRHKDVGISLQYLMDYNIKLYFNINEFNFNILLSYIDLQSNEKFIDIELPIKDIKYKACSFIISNNNEHLKSLIDIKKIYVMSKLKQIFDFPLVNRKINPNNMLNIPNYTLINKSSTIDNDNKEKSSKVPSSNQEISSIIVSVNLAEKYHLKKIMYNTTVPLSIQHNKFSLYHLKKNSKNIFLYDITGGKISNIYYIIIKITLCYISADIDSFKNLIEKSPVQYHLDIIEIFFCLVINFHHDINYFSIETLDWVNTIYQMLLNKEKYLIRKILDLSNHVYLRNGINGFFSVINREKDIDNSSSSIINCTTDEYNIENSPSLTMYYITGEKGIYDFPTSIMNCITYILNLPVKDSKKLIDLLSSTIIRLINKKYYTASENLKNINKIKKNCDLSLYLVIIRSFKNIIFMYNQVKNKGKRKNRKGNKYKQLRYEGKKNVDISKSSIVLKSESWINDFIKTELTLKNHTSVKFYTIGYFLLYTLQNGTIACITNWVNEQWFDLIKYFKWTDNTFSEKFSLEKLKYLVGFWLHHAISAKRNINEYLKIYNVVFKNIINDIDKYLLQIYILTRNKLLQNNIHLYFKDKIKEKRNNDQVLNLIFSYQEVSRQTL